MKKQAHNVKKSFLCSLLIVLTIALVGTVMSIQVFAKNETVTEGKSETTEKNTKEETTTKEETKKDTSSGKESTCTYTKAINTYNVSQSEYVVNQDGTATVKITSKAGELYVMSVDEGIYDEFYYDNIEDPSTVIKAPDYNDPAFTSVTSATHVANISEVNEKVLKKGSPIELKLTKSNSASSVVRLKLAVKTTDSTCDSYADYQAAKDSGTKKTTVFIYQYIELPQDGLYAKLDNDHYNSEACKFMRNEANNYKGIKDDIKSKYNASYLNDYKKSLAYCYNTKVNANYTDAQLNNLVSTTLQTVELNKKMIASAGGSDYGNVNFGEWKAKAEAESHVFATTIVDGKAQLVNQPGALYCEYNTIQDSRIGTTADGEKVYNYSNKHYYYAQSETVKKVTYKYDYDSKGDPAYQSSQEVDVCKVKCEEVVEVAYGPPQAVIAGFCFEYQVKVTSKTQCTAETIAAAPQEEGFCTPTPRCEHKNGFVNTQGGPNEDYDMCVQQCDGGKYTQACSKSCYNKVYGSTSKTKKSALTDEMNAKTKQVVNNVPSSGKYVRSGGSITWSGSGFQRWYVFQDTKKWGPAYMNPDINGFKRQNAGKANACDGNCFNTGCTGKVYLNPESAAADYSKNMSIYLQALSECQAGAVCTTHTSTYNISIDYDTTTTTNSKDFSGKLDSPSENPNAVNDKSSLIDKDGCYANTAQDYYRSEWTFPGTWVNNKTGEISYEEKTSGWHQQKDKVCLPLNAKEVNKRWWNWYMLEKYNKTDSTSGSITNSTTCAIGTGTLPNSDEIKWNIKAKAEKFGYYGWNFNMNCFYAVGSEMNNNTTDDDKCRVEPNNYDTRTVTNSDLFPTDKKTGSVKTEINGVTTGRTPGYNWTDAASIPEEKNDKYAVTPSVLIEKIQKLGNKVYEGNSGSEDYLDYEFDLTPQDLNNIKKFNGKYTDGANNGYNNYGNNFEYDKESKIYIYKSNLFRTSDKVISAKRVGLLGCNNQTSPTTCGTNTK